MLTINIQRVCAQRGISKPRPLMLKAGIASKSASNLLQSQTVRFSLADIEALCRALNCTPNDLFSWQPDENDSLPAEHALQRLKRTDESDNMLAALRTLPLETLDEISRLVKEKGK